MISIERISEREEDLRLTLSHLVGTDPIFAEEMCSRRLGYLQTALWMDVCWLELNGTLR
jgi:hypothetical protein